MARQKTQYNFTINRNPAEVNDLILEFLNANGFSLDQDGVTQYYHCGSSLTVLQSLEYAISGSQVTIYAYLGKPSKPTALTDGLYGALYIAPYKAKLQPLLEALANLEANPTSLASATSSPASPISAPAPTAPASLQSTTPNRFKSTNDGYAIAALILAILSLIVSFSGNFVSLVTIGLDIVLALSALKSNKRNLAIAALVITGISVVIFIIRLIQNLAH